MYLDIDLGTFLVIMEKLFFFMFHYSSCVKEEPNWVNVYFKMF